MWDLPGPGLDPVSPALAGGFSTTAPPGEPRLGFFLNARCASAQFVASLIMELGPVNISPWPAGMTLSFSAEGEGRTVEEKGLLWSRFSRLLQRVVPSAL